MLAGRPAVLIGTGPSLEAVDLDAYRASGHALVGINHAYQWARLDAWIGFDRPNEFPDDLWMDPGIPKFTRSWNRPEWLASGRRAWEAKSVDWLPVVDRIPLDWYWRAPSVPWSIDDGPREHNPGRLTFLGCLRLAWELGIRDLTLVGVDWYSDPGKSYAGDRVHTAAHCESLNRRFEAYNVTLAKLAPVLSVHGLRIVNATPGSRLTAFPSVVTGLDEETEPAPKSDNPIAV